MLITENVEGQELYLINEVYSFTIDKASLVESVDPTTSRKKITGRGEFGWCGKPTQNRRVYGQAIMEREIKRLQPMIAKGHLLGEMDHPEDGRSRSHRSAIKITELKVEPNGRVVGAFEVLSEKVPGAREMMGLLESGVKLGVSSRGSGSVREDSNGNFIVQEDFRLAVYDVVVDPAWGDALPVFDMNEATAAPPEETKKMSDEKINELNKMWESRFRELEQANEAKLAKQLSEMQRHLRESALNQARTESGLGQDAMSKLLEAVQGIAPMDQISEKKIKSLEAQNAQLVESVKTAQARLDEMKAKQKAEGEQGLDAYMDEQVGEAVQWVESSQVQSFFNLLGEKSQFTSRESFDQRLNGLKEHFKLSGWMMEASDYDIFAMLEDLTVAESLIKESKAKMEEMDKELEESRRVLSRRTALLSEAKSEIEAMSSKLKAAESEKEVMQNEMRQIKESRRELRRRLSESTSNLRAATDRVAKLNEEHERATKLISESKRELTKRRKLNERLELDIYKHKAVLGATNPVTMLEELSSASSQEAVDSLLESYQNGKGKQPSFQSDLNEQAVEKIRMTAKARSEGRPQPSAKQLNEATSTPKAPTSPMQTPAPSGPVMVEEGLPSVSFVRKVLNG